MEHLEPPGSPLAEPSTHGLYFGAEERPVDRPGDRLPAGGVDPELAMMKSRIESSNGLGALKVSLVAALAVVNERFTGMKSRVERLERRAREEKREKKAENKLTKNDIGGPEAGTFVHVAGMGIQQGEAYTFDHSAAGAPAEAGDDSDLPDPVLAQFLAQAGLDPRSLGPGDLAEARQFAERENLQGVYKEARAGKKGRSSGRKAGGQAGRPAGAELLDCQGRVAELERRLAASEQEREELGRRLCRLEAALTQADTFGLETQETLRLPVRLPSGSL